jgi:putative CocE/NonD family hydrolase
VLSARDAWGQLSGLILLSAVWLTFIPTAAAATAPMQKQGYIPMADGTQLEYTVELPASTGRFPVALQYAGYCEGTSPDCNAPNSTPALLAAGYAVLGVSIRGTSCSTGTFNAFTDQEWRDGAAAVEWAARQPWSDGHVGMYGDSFPGIMQVGVAGLRPPHLDAIAPWQVTTDLYRDVGYPGGIENSGFGAFWAGVDQPLNSYSSGLEEAEATGNATCVGALLHDLAEEPTNNVALNALQHPYVDSFWQEHEPGANAERIDIPVFGCLTWQDDEVSSRGSSYLSALDPARTWVAASNGYHGMCELSVTAGGEGSGDSPLIIDELVAFFNRFVKGEHNGFEKTPHIQFWHEAHANSAGDTVPSWITAFKSYSSIPVRPLGLYLRASGELSLTAPKSAASPDAYAYPGPATGTENGDVFGQNGLLWKGEEPPGASLAYTTPPLAHDAEFFGSGSANIWLSSTAADTDLQITLTEVRPDGQEVYVARGWLRASHRKVDPRLSTVLAPYQTDTQADALPLTAGQPTYMRIQLWPFDYIFRKGSSIRLWIDAPTGETGGWSFDYTKTPAINRIYADAAHPSAIVLGYLPGGHAEAPLPTCDTIVNQPCRKNESAVPSGTLTIPGSIPGCPEATGRLSGKTLGRVRLGMTRAQARRAYSTSTDRGRRSIDFFCLTPRGIRVGYASPKLLRTLTAQERESVRDRVVWASTSNRRYSVRGIRPGTPLALAARQLHLSKGLHIGLNWWYFAPNGTANAVLKVRHGVVEEIGIATKMLTRGARSQHALMTSFS